MLSIDGETLFPFVKCAHLLVLAKTVFIDLNQSIQDIPVLKLNEIFYFGVL